jgi:flagellar motility protein MotE (MotC chaperone)
MGKTPNSKPKAPAKAARSRLRRGSALVPLVVICFVASAGLRILGGAGEAIAEEVKGLIPASAEPPNGGPGEMAAGAGAAACPTDAELNAILGRIAEREAKAKADEARISERGTALAAAEQRIAARLKELKDAEEKLSATMSKTSSAAEDDVARLVAVYESMKPKEAVPLFEAMDPEFSAGFLARMRPDAAAAIMAGMTPERAYAVSAILAGRNAHVPVPKAQQPQSPEVGTNGAAAPSR